MSERVQLIAPRWGDPFVLEGGAPEERAQAWIDEVSRILNSGISSIDEAMIVASTADAKAVQTLALISALKRIAELSAFAPASPHPNSVKIDYLEFATALASEVGHSGKTGTICWNKDEDTLNIHHTGEVTQQVGHELYTRILNSTGSQIDNGKVVAFAGVDGSGNILGVPMIADGTIPSFFTIGIATQDIPDGENGRVTTYGRVRDFDTSAWAVDDLLYVSPTTAGELTNTKPTAPDFTIPICAVSIDDIATGEVIVRPVLEQPKYYGAFSKTSDTSPAAINTAYAIEWDNEEIASGMEIDGSVASRINVTNSGLYEANVSFQISSGSSSAKNTYHWFRKNGTDIANTTFKVSLESNSAIASPSRSYFFSLAAGDYIEVMWASSSTNVTLDYSAATAFAPASPAVILTIDQIQQ